MAMAMLNQVLYPVPGPLKGFVAHAFASIVEWDSKFCSTMLTDGNMANLFITQLYTFVVSCSYSSSPLHYDTDIVFSSELEKLHPSPVTREICYDIFRFCGFLIRHFGLPRLSPYQRSPPEANKEVSQFKLLPTQLFPRS